MMIALHKNARTIPGIRAEIAASHAYSQGHDSQLGLVAGMAVMAVSLLLMQ